MGETPGSCSRHGRDFWLLVTHSHCPVLDSSSETSEGLAGLKITAEIVTKGLFHSLPGWGTFSGWLWTKVPPNLHNHTENVPQPRGN